MIALMRVAFPAKREVIGFPHLKFFFDLVKNKIEVNILKFTYLGRQARIGFYPRDHRCPQQLSEQIMLSLTSYFTKHHLRLQKIYLLPIVISISVYDIHEGFCLLLFCLTKIQAIICTHKKNIKGSFRNLNTMEKLHLRLMRAEFKKKKKKFYLCKENEHFKKNCSKRKMWLEKKGMFYISINFKSSLIEVSNNTWCLDYGVTTHVLHIMQDFLMI